MSLVIDDEIKAKLIRMFWEAFDKSDSVINYQRGNDDIPHQYYEGYSEGLGEVLDLFGIDPDSDIPARIKADMDERYERQKARLAEHGIDLDELYLRAGVAITKDIAASGDASEGG